jgi:hypothetical protein
MQHLTINRERLEENEAENQYTREVENISRGPIFGDYVTIRTEASMQDVSVARHYRVRYKSTESPLKCNVLRESLSVDSQNIPCATLKRRGSWVISVYLCGIPTGRVRNVWNPPPPSPRPGS